MDNINILKNYTFFHPNIFNMDSGSVQTGPKKWEDSNFREMCLKVKANSSTLSKTSVLLFYLYITALRTYISYCGRRCLAALNKFHKIPTE